MKVWCYKNRQGQTLLELNPIVFGSSTVLILGFVMLALLYVDDFATLVTILQADIANGLGWLFVLAVNLILGYLIFLVMSPYGAICLGVNEAKLEFSL